MGRAHAVFGVIVGAIACGRVEEERSAAQIADGRGGTSGHAGTGGTSGSAGVGGRLGGLGDVAGLGGSMAGGAGAAGTVVGVPPAAGSGGTSGGSAGPPLLSTSCGAPAKPGAALTAVGTDFCVDGWCAIVPKPTFAGFRDALLLEGDTWAATTGRQVIAKTSAGLVQLGPAFATRVTRLAGTSLMDLYGAPDGTSDRLWHFDGSAWKTLDPAGAGDDAARRAVGLQVAPSGAVYVLDDDASVTRFDGCGVKRWPSISPWTNIATFVVSMTSTWSG